MQFSEIILSLELGIIYGIIATGLFITFRIIDFPDLTCDGTFVLGSAVIAICLKAGFNIFIALFCSILAGGLAGLATGILFSKFKINNLLSGILVSFMLYSINLRIMSMQPNITINNTNFIFTEYPIIGSTIIAITLYFLITYLLSTNFGLALRSIGYNQTIAKKYGINISYMTIIALFLSNSIIALGAGLVSLSQGFADIGSGTGTVVIGFASILIGEKILTTTNQITRILSCFLGAIVYRLIISFALHSDFLGLVSSDLNLITGILVIFITSLNKKFYVSFKKY